MAKNIVKEWDVAAKNNGLDAYFAAIHEDEKPSIFERVHDWFKYTIIIPVRDWNWNVIAYFHNRKLFNKMLWKWRAFDYRYQFELFAFGLEQLAKSIENGYEVEVSRNKKVEAIKKLIDVLNSDYEDGLWDKYMGKFYNDTTVHVTKFEDGSYGFKYINMNEDDYAKSLEKYKSAVKSARNKHYKTMFHLIEGQDNEKVSKIIDAEVNQIISDLENKGETVTPERKEKITEETTFKHFDGSGIETWWD